MKVRCVIAMLLAMAYCQEMSAQVHRATDMSVLGIRLGEKFSISECKRKAPLASSGLSESGADLIQPPPSPYLVYEMLEFDAKAPCFEHVEPTLARPDTPVVTEYLKVQMPIKKMPFGSNDIWVWVMHGNAEGVQMNTFGLNGQDLALSELKKKYGPPSSSEEVKKGNAVGAVFLSHLAVWRFSNLFVRFEGDDGQH